MFPVHYHLKYAGLLPPLDMPHHMRRDDVSLYREGMVIDSQIGEGTRVTVKLLDLDNKSSDNKTTASNSS
eukprot:gene33437-41260_t